MRDPKKVMTETGYIRLRAHLLNITDALFYIRNHADDLLLDEPILEMIWEMEKWMDEHIEPTINGAFGYDEDDQ